MMVQTAFQAPSHVELRPPRCPRCGSALLVAEESAFNPNGRIRHTWSCDACGNEFVTSVRVLPRQA
jgi:ribosomal protein S27AE